MEENTPGHVAAVETEIIYPNYINSAADANSGITNTIGVFEDSDAPYPIFTINPTPEVEIDNENEDNEDDDDDEDYDDENGTAAEHSGIYPTRDRKQ